eukprot:scaffold21213_cov142-Isochrysis_galbana.AAC.1
MQWNIFHMYGPWVLDGFSIKLAIGLSTSHSQSPWVLDGCGGASSLALAALPVDGSVVGGSQIRRAQAFEGIMHQSEARHALEPGVLTEGGGLVRV